MQERDLHIREQAVQRLRSRDGLRGVEELEPKNRQNRRNFALCFQIGIPRPSTNNRKAKNNMQKLWQRVYWPTRWRKLYFPNSITKSMRYWSRLSVSIYNLQSKKGMWNISYANAFTMCKELHELYVRCFPPGSPNVAIVEYKLGKLEVYESALKAQ